MCIFFQLYIYIIYIITGKDTHTYIYISYEDIQVLLHCFYTMIIVIQM